MKERISSIGKLLLPYLAAGISLLAYYGLADNGRQKEAAHPYYINLLLIVSGGYAVLLLISLFQKKLLDITKGWDTG